MRLIMVARPPVAALCNDAAANADPDGGAPFDVELVLPATGAPAALWCSWDMAPAVATRIRDWMLAKGATQAEASPVPKGTPMAVVRAQRIAVFAGTAWTPAQVLALLGMAPRPADPLG